MEADETTGRDGLPMVFEPHVEEVLEARFGRRAMLYAERYPVGTATTTAAQDDDVTIEI